jgi:hypothetical protein
MSLGQEGQWFPSAAEPGRSATRLTRLDAVLFPTGARGY